MFKGKWRNELGSILNIVDVNPDGTLTGTYNTAVGDDDVVGKGEPVSGRYNGELISFIADFEGTGSMTTWMGRYEQISEKARGIEEERINTVWVLGRTMEGEDDEKVEMWATFLTNANTFTKE